MEQNDAPLSIQQQRETYIREDGTIFTRADIFVKLSVVFRDRMLCKLKGPKLSVYLCIALHCSDEEMIAWPSLATIAQETGYSNRAVIDAIDDLQKMGLVEVEHRIKDDGSPNSNRYRVRGYATMGEGGSEPSSQPPCTTFTAGSEPSSHKEESIKEETIEESDFPPTAPRGDNHDGNGNKPITEYDSWLGMSAEVKKRRGTVPDWAMQTEGVHPALSVVRAFCDMTGQRIEDIKDGPGDKLLRHYLEIARKGNVTLAQMAEAHLILPQKEWGEWHLEHHAWITGYETAYISKLILAAQKVRDGIAEQGKVLQIRN